jgi:hypothetical protein
MGKQIQIPGEEAVALDSQFISFRIAQRAAATKKTQISERK